MFSKAQHSLENKSDEPSNTHMSYWNLRRQLLPQNTHTHTANFSYCWVSPNSIKWLQNVWNISKISLKFLFQYFSYINVCEIEMFSFIHLYTHSVNMYWSPTSIFSIQTIYNDEKYRFLHSRTSVYWKIEGSIHKVLGLKRRKWAFARVFGDQQRKLYMTWILMDWKEFMKGRSRKKDISGRGSKVWGIKEHIKPFTILKRSSAFRYLPPVSSIYPVITFSLLTLQLWLKWCDHFMLIMKLWWW